MNAAGPAVCGHACRCRVSALWLQLDQRHAIGIHCQHRTVLMPVTQHHTGAQAAIDQVLVDGRAMGMAVDHALAAKAGEGVGKQVVDIFEIIGGG